MSGSEQEQSGEEERKEDLTSLPPTPESHTQDVSSDTNSAASDRRKYQRGGRKKSTSVRERKSRIGAVPEKEETEDDLLERAERDLVQDAPDEAIGGDEHDDPEEEYYQEEEGEDDEEEEEQEEQIPTQNQPAHRESVKPKTKQEKLCPNCSAKAQAPAQQQQQQQPERATPFETGIKAFNLKRAESSGGGRPIGVRNVPNTTGKKSKKSKSKSKEKKKKSKRAMDESDEEDSEESEEERDPDGVDKQKPMSIRLDLNLMVQIFLKARIKGDVTITFLE